ncbi:hypothetical protein NM688_g3061 [Phlebia brevispora]|uniref:Uncharacterized protein n=1 Tax=Phlebia brevispora TaxID=194682 RepID=A0ACC1T6Y7_9APHY|nr:hypothetical protein NM688_g3061 [Phlebia brevispora]
MLDSPFDQCIIKTISPHTDQGTVSNFYEFLPLRRKMVSKLHGQPMASQMSLAERRHVFFSSDAGLSSVEGARTVIDAISSRRAVSKLTLSHNRLGDEGFRELFDFLCSDDGSKYQIDEMDLHNCGMGTDALLGLSEYIGVSTSLRTLHLQQNDFGLDTDSMVTFTTAINRSKVSKLILSSLNCSPTADAVLQLLERLDNPFLHELTLSYNGLTSAAVPTVTSFITSPRCHLRILRLSANKMGNQGIQFILSAMEHNYSLSTIDLYGNIGDEGDNPATDRPAGRDEARKRILQRNDHLRKMVEREALQLLRYSRILLLEHIPSGFEEPKTGITPLIPAELRLYILSFFAPTLTDAQRVRIFNFASSWSTLPRMLSLLSPPSCLRDPATLPFGHHVLGAECSNGRCMGSATRSELQERGRKVGMADGNGV